MQEAYTTIYAAEGAVVRGDVQLGDEVSIWYHATVRGDSASVKIGKRSNVQDNVVIHTDKDHPVLIGEDVTIGHGAIVHGCMIGDGSLIGMGAIVLNGARIGRNCMIGAGALVTQGMEIPDGSLAFGNPAKVRRSLSEEEIQANMDNAAMYVREGKEQLEERHIKECSDLDTD